MIQLLFSPVTAVHPLTLPLIFVSGILGSAHCIGMCGGISATIGLGAGRLSTAFFRQLWGVWDGRLPTRFWECCRPP